MGDEAEDHLAEEQQEWSKAGSQFVKREEENYEEATRQEQGKQGVGQEAVDDWGSWKSPVETRVCHREEKDEDEKNGTGGKGMEGEKGKGSERQMTTADENDRAEVRRQVLLHSAELHQGRRFPDLPQCQGRERVGSHEVVDEAVRAEDS